jgi:hypothetical protein
MLGYRIVKIETDPAEAWVRMKEAANELAVSLCEAWQEICQETREKCGQDLYMTILPGISIGRTQVCVRAGDQYMWLPKNPKDHWEYKASQVREAIEKMASVAREHLQEAANNELEK